MAPRKRVPANHTNRYSGTGQAEQTPVLGNITCPNPFFKHQ
jgi:hypothetical protein